MVDNCFYSNCNVEISSKTLVMVQVVNNYQFVDTNKYCSYNCLKFDMSKKNRIEEQQLIKRRIRDLIKKWEIAIETELDQYSKKYIRMFWQDCTDLLANL